MRENKYRAWDKENEKMWKDFPCFLLIDIADGKIFNTVEDSYVSERYVLMQYTGLKAKNGEIYEGDIIEDKFILTILEPHEKRTEKPFEVKIPDIYYQKEFNGYDLEADFEIIGNVYEDPELLEGIE